MKKLILSFVALLVITNTYANCEKPAPGYDTTYCFAKLFLQSDDELNAAYKALSALLNPEQKKRLISAQRSWIKYRNAKCYDRGSIMVDCNFEVNKNRTKFLLDRVTECKIGSCKNDLIGSENFN